MTVKFRYVLHEGYIRSENDEQVHFISGPRLAKLWGVPLSQCVVHSYYLKGKMGDIHLSPRDDGKYSKIT